MLKKNSENQKPAVKKIHQLQDAGKIETLLGTINGYSRKLLNGPNDKAARGVLRLSSELSQMYAENLLEDFETCFRKNVEYELWKGCFYSPIEALRKRSEDGGPHSDLFKEFLNELIEQAIAFYENLLLNYQEKFNVDFASLYQSYANILSLENLDECTIVDRDFPFIDSMILRSAQRHLIYSADLYRYKAAITDKETRNYSPAKKLYWHAHLLEPQNGHPFNQLAVVACYEKKWVDVLFYYIRALSVFLPFKSSRESLELALNSLRDPAVTYGKWIFALIEENKNILSMTNNVHESGPYSVILQNENKTLNNYREIWIHPSNNNKIETMGYSQQPSKQINIEETLSRLFVDENGKNIQKKAICHLLHCAGILISTIGLDQFKRSYELVLKELASLVLIDDTILSPSYLLKILVLYTFPVHSPRSDASHVLIENQRDIALEIVFSFLERLLEIIFSDLDKIGLFILAGQLSRKFSCILPSICFLGLWIYRLDRQLLLPTSCYYRVLELFVLIGNRLFKLSERRSLFSLSTIGVEDNKDSIRIILPEFLLLTPYFDILSKDSNQFYIDSNSIDVDILDKDHNWITMQTRFAFILHICEQFATDDYFLITMDCTNINDGPFRLNSYDKGKEIQTQSTFEIKHEIVDSDDNEIGNENTSIGDLMEGTSADEHKLKNQLFSEKNSNVHQRIVEVRPKYLVCDTNTLIDYPEEIRFIVSLKIFILLVPAIVIDELSSLVKGVQVNNPTLLPREILNPKGSHSEFVMQRATKAIEWLREAAEHKDGNIFTVTQNGNIIQRPSFVTESVECNAEKRTNDDKILSACVNLCKRLIKTAVVSKPNEETLERTVVLMTEDRGLSAKAAAEWIPVCTFPNFIKWFTKNTEMLAKTG